MSTLSMEQSHHKINLGRIVKRLERVGPEGKSNEKVWIHARGTLQKVKYARSLLKNLELDDATPGAEQRYQAMRISLERVESVARKLEQSHAPPPRPRTSLLSKLPPPITHVEEPTPLPATEEPTPASDLLLIPDDAPPPPITIPSSSTTISTGVEQSLQRAAAKSTTHGKPLQNSAALQEELSAQLAQMASQLKANARHFSNSLANDQATVDSASEKLDRNHDVMVKERIRLRDHSGKSNGTTRLTIIIIILVSVLFVWLFLLIRITGK